MDNVFAFNQIENISSYCCVLGLNFPDSATEFQKAALTLAHLMASCRDFVLKGVDMPEEVITVIYQLATLVESNKTLQR